MGQIVSTAAKPKRCNANQLSQLGVLAAGLHVLVSTDNSMNAAGQGNFDAYIVGDGTTASTALSLHKIETIAEALNEQINGAPTDYEEISPEATSGYIITYDGVKTTKNAGAITEPIALSAGDSIKMTARGEYSMAPMSLYNASTDSYTAINRYEGTSPTEQTFVYTAVADCQVVCCYRHAYAHTILVKDISATSGGLVEVINGKIGDAPIDGKSYVRKNGDWSESDESTVAELQDIVMGATPDYVPLSVNVNEGDGINYAGTKITGSSVEGLTDPISLAVGDKLKLVAFDTNSMSPMALFNESQNTYTPLNRYEGTSPTEQTFEYEATDTCKVVCTFRYARAYSIYKKAAPIEGLAEQMGEKIDDAPVNGKQYARKDANWVEIDAANIIEKKSINIIPNEWEIGFITSTGSETGLTSAFRSSVYIPIETGATITAMLKKDQLYPLSSVNICEYTEGKVFIRRSTAADSPFVIGNTTAFIRICADVGGDISSTYTEYGSRVGFAYGNMRLPWSDYDLQTYLDEDVLIDGVHKHAYPLKWLAMGDSITDGSYSVAGDGSSDGDDATHTDRSVTWVQKCADITGFVYDNIAIGGTGWLKQGSQNDKKNAKQLADETDFTKYDLVTLAYGINDVKSPSPTFTFGDVTDSETANTLAGAMKYVFNKILTANPTCKVVVISPLNCRWGNGNVITNNWALGYTFAGGKTLEDMYQLMKSVCDYCGIQMIDMTHTSIINRYNMVAMTPDTIHPTLEAHERMAWQIANSFDYDN